MRWQGPLLLVAGHLPHRRHFQLRADDTALPSTFFVSAIGPSCWSPATHHTDDNFRVRADDIALRSTLLASAFGPTSSPTAGNIYHSAAELPEPHPSDLLAPRSASMLHCTSPLVASTSPKNGRRPVLCFAFGAETYARRATDKHTGINPSNDHRRGLRLLREPIDHHTPLLSEPDRLSRDPLGLRAPCSRS